MTADGRVTGTTAAAPAPTLAYVAGVAALAPLALNAAVGLQPAFADGSVLDAAGRSGLVAWYALGLGIGQVIAGDGADRWGRRPTLLAGLLVAAVGSLWAAGAGGAGELLAGRFLAGIGLGTALVVPRAALRDMYHGAALQRAMAIVALVFALAPTFTPPLTWVLAAQTSWRVSLGGVGLLVVLGLLATWWLQPETRPAGTAPPGVAAWRALWANRRSRSTSLAFAAMAAPFFIFAAAGPAALTQSTGVGGGTAVTVLGLTYLGFIAGNHWVKRNAGRAGHRVFTSGVVIAAAGIALLAATLAWPSLALWLIALTVYAVGHGIVFPSAFALVLQDMPHQAGLAAAGVGAVHLSLGAATGWLAGALPLSPHASVVATAALAAAVSCAAWLTYPFREDAT